MEEWDRQNQREMEERDRQKERDFFIELAKALK